MPITSAVGVSTGSGSATAFGSTRPQSVATAARAAFVREEFRSVVWQSTAVRTAYGKVARDTKDDPIVTYFDDIADAYTIAQERGQILGSHARRFRVIIDDILTENELQFATALPGAHLIDDELVADMDVAIAAIEGVDFNNGQTTILVWGRVGSVPTTDDRIRNSPASAAGTSSALAVGLTLGGVIAAASGSGDATGVSVANIGATASSSGVGAAAAVGVGRLPAVGSASGVGTVTAVGVTRRQAVASSTGSGTAAAVAAGPSVGSAAGVGTATAVGSSTAASAGASSGSSTPAALSLDQYTSYYFEVTGNGGDSYTSCAEIQMYESSGGTNYAPGTGTFTASSSYGDGILIPSKLNDGSFAYPGMWTTASGVSTPTITATLSSAKMLAEFKWWVPSGETARQPSGIVLKGSNDGGTTKTTIKTFNGITGWVSAAAKTFSIASNQGVGAASGSGSAAAVGTTV